MTVAATVGSATGNSVPCNILGITKAISSNPREHVGPGANIPTPPSAGTEADLCTPSVMTLVVPPVTAVH